MATAVTAATNLYKTLKNISENTKFQTLKNFNFIKKSHLIIPFKDIEIGKLYEVLIYGKSDNKLPRTEFGELEKKNDFAALFKKKNGRHFAVWNNDSHVHFYEIDTLSNAPFTGGSRRRRQRRHRKTVRK